MFSYKHQSCSQQRSVFPDHGDFTGLNPNFADGADNDVNVGADLAPRVEILRLMERDLPLLHNFYTLVRRAIFDNRKRDVPITGEWEFTGIATSTNDAQEVIALIIGCGTKMRIERATRERIKVEEEFLVGYVGDGLMKVFTSVDFSEFIGPVPDFEGTTEQTIDYLNGFYSDI